MHGMKAAEFWAALATLPPNVCLTTEFVSKKKKKLLQAHLTPKEILTGAERCSGCNKHLLHHVPL
jgi:hypothetical protein